MHLSRLSSIYLPAVEEDLQAAVKTVDGDRFSELYAMLAYHMGWLGDGAGAKASGKRIRPLLVLLTCQAAGGEWKAALPAASAVELVHNFSLIHDDIEDDSSLRRGRTTVWKKWGLAQGLNAGDAMYTLAHLAILRLRETATSQIALNASSILLESCLQLTQGQYLDISYETRRDLTVDDYWPMVRGKTAALLAACTELGALNADCEEGRQASFRLFGQHLGLAFQAQDDLLGIWGDAALTGKSAESDLITGKKTLPVLFGLNAGGSFAQRWLKGSITPEELDGLARQLEDEGARGYTQDTADRLTQLALGHLEDAQPQGEAGMALKELADLLLNRQG